MTIIAKDSTVETYNYIIDFTNVSKRNTVHMTLTDKSKYAYENGYRKQVTHKMSNKGIVSFDNDKIDLSNLSGIKQLLEDLNARN